MWNVCVLKLRSRKHAVLEFNLVCILPLVCSPPFSLTVYMQGWLGRLQMSPKHMKFHPRMVYPYHSVIKSLQQLLNRRGFWDKCQEWRKQVLPGNVKTDIYQGNVWKELSSTGFLSHVNSLARMLNVDWFRSHKHSPGSVGVIYLMLLNLPCHERYKLENIVVVGILPGPSEPKITANTFLEPLVRELQELWACKHRFTVSGSFLKRPIKVGLICVSSDIPATRKIGGFLGHMAAQGCSRCKKNFNSQERTWFQWYINELSGKKFCAKFSLMQCWTSNPIADLKTSRGWLLCLHGFAIVKKSAFALSFFRIQTKRNLG